MKLSADFIRQQINKAIPEGSVVPVHNEKGHFYKIMTPDKEGNTGNVYPSVTGKIQIIKDESLINYKMNQAIQYVFRKYKEFNDSNIMEHLDFAARASVDVLVDAGDIGTEIHNARQKYFENWIKTGIRPANVLDYIPPDNPDIRMKSALSALETFCVKTRYEPIATELFVYSHDLEIAGTLDDIGIMDWVIGRENPNCDHVKMDHHKVADCKDCGKEMRSTCLKCGTKWRRKFVLMDIKTSNQFKDHYFFQVALYYFMFLNLVKVTPERSFILKLSKVDCTYKVEDLKSPSILCRYAKSMVRTSNGIQYIRSLRKDNQKSVGEFMQL